MSKTTKFTEWLNKQIGHIYVWGAQGETATPEFIKKHETNSTNINRALALYNKRKSEGKSPILAYDCSGLIVCYLLENKLISGDSTASGLYSKCTQIKQSDLKAGDLVFHHNGNNIHHVGVYIGDNKVIHAKGRDVGVVKEQFSTNNWNRFGRYDKLQEREETQMAKVITKTNPLMKGEDIKKLQTALNALGYDCGTADGVAGDKTITAVQEFANAHTTQKLPECVSVTVKVGEKCYRSEAKG